MMFGDELDFLSGLVFCESDSMCILRYCGDDIGDFRCLTGELFSVGRTAICFIITKGDTRRIATKVGGV